MKSHLRRRTRDTAQGRRAVLTFMSTNVVLLGRAYAEIEITYGTDIAKAPENRLKF